MSWILIAWAVAGSPLEVDEMSLLTEDEVLSLDLEQTGIKSARYVLPNGLEPAGSRTINGLTWTYVGQYEFLLGDAEQAADGVRRFTTSVEDEGVRLQAVDAFGRHWELNQSWSPSGLDKATDFSPGEDVEWIPTAFDGEDCIDNHPGLPGFVNEHFWWDGNSQVPSEEAGWDPWERATVLLNNRESGGLCSGALVSVDGRGEPEWVLTAAHCVEAGPWGRFALPANLRVILPGSDRSFGVATTIVPASYSSWPGADFRSDIALLELVPQPSDLKSDEGQAPLANVVPHVYRLATTMDTAMGQGARSVGWPTYLQGCEVASWGPYTNIDDVLGRHRRRHVQLWMDGGPGYSGSPVERCEGECRERGTGEIIAVFSGWNSISKTHVGPRVPFYADAFNAVME